MATKAKTTGRYVCPQQLEVRMCEEHGFEFPHVREEWLQRGQKVPLCETHAMRLYRFPE